VTHYMMKCGHVAQAIKDKDIAKPVCVICFGINKGADEIDTSYVIPEGRRARCLYYGEREGSRGEGPCHSQSDRVCRCEKSSSLDLAFFERQPDKEFDGFYCGCAFGWD